MMHLNLTSLPAIVLVSVAVGLTLVRARSVRVKLASEMAALLVILATLVDRGASPLPAWQALAGRPDGAWLRGLAVVWWLVGARLVATLVALARGRDAKSRQARLFSDLVAGVIYISAAYIIADSILDLPVRTLVATSGVIAVVLGLALQNTLSDLFSGIAVGIEQPFKVGDDITLDSGLEGEITDTNWRSVRLRTSSGDIANIPNSVIAKATVTNHSRPSRRRAVSVEIPVRSHAPAGHLIELLRESLLLCPDVLELPEPSIAIKSLDRLGASFALTFHVIDSSRLLAARGQVLHQARRFLRHGGVLTGQEEDVRGRLKGTALFEELKDAPLSAVEAALVSGQLEPGETLLTRGEWVDALTIVSAGVLEVTAGEPDAPLRVGRIGPGEYLGDIGMASGEPSPVTVRALTAVDMLQLEKSSLMRLVETEPELAGALERSVRRGLARLERDAAARAAHPVKDEQTFLRRLQRLLRPIPRRVEDPSSVA